jgi:cobalt-zinc-cadmium efflux system membrane fusion protein
MVQSGAASAQPAGDALPRSRRAPEVKCTKSDSVIRLASGAVAQAAGLAWQAAREEEVARLLVRNCEVEYNANRYAHLSSRAPGVVAEVRKDLGEAVTEGEVVCIVESVELGTAKAELLLAKESVQLWEANVARERGLVERGIGVERELLDAQTKLAESRISLARARQQLRALGLTASQVSVVEETGDTSALLELRAPFAGIVVERHAVLGEVVAPTEPLIEIADTRSMWAMADLSEGDLGTARVGDDAILRISGLEGESFAGTVTWVSTKMDPKTRTIKARAEVANPDGLLRAHMFGTVEIRGKPGDPKSVTVPRDAVQWEGCCNVVFVREGTDDLVWHPRKVQLGAAAGGRCEVLSGLKAGEEVATTGSFLLKTELMKGAIGAGCCEVDHLAK